MRRSRSAARRRATSKRSSPTVAGYCRCIAHNRWRRSHPTSRSRAGRTRNKKAGSEPAFLSCVRRSVVLLFLGRALERLHAGGAALDHRGDVVEVAGADFLLMRHERVALVARLELRLLHLL